MNYEYDAAAIGTRIRELRRQKGDTQAVLAEKLQVSIDTVKRMENGTGGSIYALWMTAREYGVSLDYLVSGKTDDLLMDELLGDCSEQERTFIWNTLLCAAQQMKKSLSCLKQ